MGESSTELRRIKVSATRRPGELSETPPMIEKDQGFFAKYEFCGSNCRFPPGIRPSWSRVLATGEPPITVGIYLNYSHSTEVQNSHLIIHGYEK